MDERNAEVERELGEIKERLRLTESQLLEERNARNRLTQQVRKRHSCHKYSTHFKIASS